MGSAALSRMPLALTSLAVWSVVSGFIFILWSMGMAFNVYQSWFQGILLHVGETRGITRGNCDLSGYSLVVLIVGVRMGAMVGLYVGWAAFSLGGLAQMFRHRRRASPALEALRQRI